MSVKSRVVLLFGILFLVGLSLWFFYSPEHWLRKIDLGTVRVDGRPSKADFYIGQPTGSEAEAIALVHVPGIGNYFFDFGSEKYRQASEREFLHLPAGVWTVESMRRGEFVSPLPSHVINQLQIASSGHVVTVQF